MRSAPAIRRPSELAAIPLARQAEPSAEEACKDAADRCACVVAGFFRVAPDQLYSATRGAARVAVARQIWIAGLVAALGFETRIVARVVGRDEDTIKHACKIVEAVHGAVDSWQMVKVLGEKGVREFLGGEAIVLSDEEIISGGEAFECFMDDAERTLDRLFESFVTVAVQGRAYCEDQDLRTREQRGKA